MVHSSTYSDAGAVNILYGSSDLGLNSGGNQFWHQNSAGVLDFAEASDSFGFRLAAGDFDGDGYDDLAIGVLGESIGAILDVGAVNVLYGSNSIGLTSTGDQFWHQNSRGVLGEAETIDGFGSSLAVGDFDGDGYDDLAIGSYGEDIETVINAGSVNVLYGSSFLGLTSEDNQFWTQSIMGPNAIENDDDFGESLSSGDFNGDGNDDLAIGVPNEDATSTDAGMVNVLYGSIRTGLSSSGNQVWHQDKSGILDVAEEGDLFGSGLTAGDFDGNGVEDLAIGAPSEDVSLRVSSSGAVNVLYGAGGGLSPLIPGDQNLKDGDEAPASQDLIPHDYRLEQSYPNPFNPSTTIDYSIKTAGSVKLIVYNSLGQEVRTLVDNFQAAGYHTVLWDGKDNSGRQVASGVYVYRITAGNFVRSQKMILAK